MKSVQLEIYEVGELLPAYGLHVLVFYKNSEVDRGALYGECWRLADFSEDQLEGVTHWAYLPHIAEQAAASSVTG